MSVKVVTTAVPYDPFADRITGAVPKGKGPDVFVYAQDRLGGWVEKLIVAPFPADKKLTDRFLMNTIVKKSATPEAALKTAQQEVEAAIAQKKK